LDAAGRVFVGGLLCATLAAGGSARARDVLPRLDLDEAPPGMPVAEGRERVRWLLRPRSPDIAAARLPGIGVERVGQLDRFGGWWILEAPLVAARRVEGSLASLGELRRDRSGRPALLNSTTLVGARAYVWSTLDLRGDRLNSVAILDSGCDTAHDDLGDIDFDNEDQPPESAGDADDWQDATEGWSAEPRIRVVGWHDVTDDMPGSAGPYDYHLHGTAIASAGFGGGVIDPRRRGVAPEGRMVIVKTWNFEGRWELFASDLLLGLQWVLENHVDYRIRACLIGAVWDEDLGISEAVEALLDAGIVVIAPAGNDPEATMGWPARIPDVICVGAVDFGGQVAPYSTPSLLDQQSLDLVAPGGNADDPAQSILVADNEPNDLYRGRFGSSLAAAHVAGAVSLLSQTMDETGRPWVRSRAQVRWIQDLLRVTTVETERGQRLGGLVPRLDRIGPDGVEGWGLLQVGALVDAVRRQIWPGQRASFTLGSPQEGQASWAARVPVTGSWPLRLELLPPEGADFDLLLYEERADGLDLVGWSTSPLPGQFEQVQLSAAKMGSYVVVVRRVSGGGPATILVAQDLNRELQWPIRLSARQLTAPAVVDLDADGKQEVVLVNNLAVDPTVHQIVIVRADGRPFGRFPAFFDSPGDRPGDLSAPAIADFGAGYVILAGGQGGQVFAVDAQAQLLWRTDVSGFSSTTAGAVQGEGAAARIVVGTADGVVILDPAGGIERSVPLAEGVALDPAIGDLDGDGTEEIVVVDGTAVVHALEIDGTELPGWPIALDPGSSPTAPVLVGSGSGADWVVVAHRTAQGEAQLLVWDGAGLSREGSPFALSFPGNLRAVSPVVASATLRGEAPAFLLSTLARDGSNRLVLRGYRIAGDLSSQSWTDLEIVRQGFEGTLLNLSAMALGAPRVGEISSRGEAEIIYPLQLAWSEFYQASIVRYGSTQRAVGLTAGEVDPRLDLSVKDGHQMVLSPSIVPPVLADLDADGRSELIFVRENEVYLQGGWMPNDPTDYWGVDRFDARRSACVGCAAPVTVGGPALPARAARLVAVPNPFNPRTELRLEAPGGALSRWEIFDARGRRVRGWDRWLEEGPSHREIWEGTNDDGQGLPSGVYWVRVESRGVLARARVVLVR
jgi:hypothetical protein